MDKEYTMNSSEAFAHAFAKRNNSIRKLANVTNKPNHSSQEEQNIRDEIAFYNYVIDSTGMSRFSK